MSGFAARLLEAGSPFELLSVQTAGLAVKQFRHLPISLNSLYKRAARSALAPCMHFRAADVPYGEVFDQARVLAAALIERHGIRTGDRIALRASNGPQWLAAFVAITSVGAVAVLLPQEMALDHCRRALDMAGCLLLLVDEPGLALPPDLSAGRPVILMRARSPSGTFPYFEDISAATSALDPLSIEIAPDQEALITFTSGSTGAPKGVICSHRAILSGLMNATLGGALASARNRVASERKSDAPAVPCSLSLAPFAHVAGYMHLLLSMQVAARTIPLVESDTATIARLIERHRVTTLGGMNAETLAALLSAEECHRRLASLTNVSIHGNTLRATLAEKIRKHLPHVRPATSYGLTETCGPVACGVGADLFEKPESCGAILPSLEVRVVDEQGETMPIGKTGEIWLSGSMLMSGYCAAPRETARTLVNGWLRTEDFGYVDSHGFLFVQERLQDLHDWNGERLSLARLERAICSDAPVKDAAVLRAEDSLGRPRLIVAIVPDSADGNEARSVSLASVSATAGVPRESVEVIALAGLPRTGIGKIDRRALQAMLVDRKQ